MRIIFLPAFVCTCSLRGHATCVCVHVHSIFPALTWQKRSGRCCEWKIADFPVTYIHILVDRGNVHFNFPPQPNQYKPYSVHFVFVFFFLGGGGGVAFVTFCLLFVVAVF